MPLQGLSLKTKIDLLEGVLKKDISLKEMATKSKNIKSRQKIIRAFLIKFTGEEDWEDLQREFPKHTTESQISQFQHLTWRANNIPEEMKHFFSRAVSWREKRHERLVQSQSVVEEGEHFLFSNGRGFAIHGCFTQPGLDKISLPSFKGTELVIANAPKGMDDEELRMFLINIHSVNVEQMAFYNVAVIVEGGLNDMGKLKPVLENKMVPGSVQTFFWNDTRKLPLKGRLVQNRIKPVLVGHWSGTNTITHGNCHFGADEVETNARRA